jgi:hypothetical protein
MTPRSAITKTGRAITLAFALATAAGTLGMSGCATVRAIPGTKIADTPVHRQVLQRVEEYRVAMEQRDAARLLSMAHPNYYEDSGTPSGSDDYGYPGLKRVLENRLSSLRWLRYLIKYRDIRVDGNRAQIDLRYDISFQLMTEIGEKWERRQNDKRIELQREENRWLIISGM